MYRTAQVLHGGKLPGVHQRIVLHLHGSQTFRSDLLGIAVMTWGNSFWAMTPPCVCMPGLEEQTAFPPAVLLVAAVLWLAAHLSWLRQRRQPLPLRAGLGLERLHLLPVARLAPAHPAWLTARRAAGTCAPLPETWLPRAHRRPAEPLSHDAVRHVTARPRRRHRRSPGDPPAAAARRGAASRGRPSRRPRRSRGAAAPPSRPGCPGGASRAPGSQSRCRHHHSYRSTLARQLMEQAAW
jgi:hypothetical protein